MNTYLDIYKFKLQQINPETSWFVGTITLEIFVCEENLYV